MSCCKSAGAHSAVIALDQPAAPAPDAAARRTVPEAEPLPDKDEGAAPDVARFVREASDGLSELNLMIEGIHCGGCVKKIEGRLNREPDVRHARVNMTTRRLSLRWQGPASRGNDLVAAVADLGYAAVPYDPARLGAADARGERELLRAMAVAGFAAANVMLLSVSVWAGHFEGMGETTRTLLHWFSALIALPAIVYAGRPFFRSALGALAHRRTNMDVPISLAIVLASAMSLWETMRGGPHAYFDSAVMLLFFLLVGRDLDSRARGKARSAAERLLALRRGSVAVLRSDGRQETLPAEDVETGMRVLVAAGERVAVDGRILAGQSELDASLINGETLPQPARKGDRVFAGTLNIAAPLTIEVDAVGEDTLLAEIVRLMEVAEQRRARYVDLADRVARFYAPAVHSLAAGAFLGWWLLGGLAWQQSLLIAVAVLIITCPCALGLAVPAVQVIASGRLMRRGTLLKSGSALERMARADTVVFDKTGTLTLGRPEIEAGADDEALAQAARLAAASRHPLARAVSRACRERNLEVEPFEDVREVPGCGLSVELSDGDEIRLGNRRWCGLSEDTAAGEDAEIDGPELWLVRPGREPVRFGFSDPLRPDAAQTVSWLRRRGFDVHLLSGDRRSAVARVAAELGIEDWQAECAPADKVARLEALAAEGRKVLMVGDGLNDAPALAAASVSMSPASAVDISQTAADAVFQGSRLAPVREALTVSRRAGRLVGQNFTLAFGYNVITVPIALAGLVTPLIAAVAMSASSLLVTGNALRLARTRD
ncbi:MAG: heavy metal translocating P-type ATPase [Rhodovibrionaceae bacterium]|nr:heavy metal translocating P-type ATPase [Rhodovibrionaceae bacterium]